MDNWEALKTSDSDGDYRGRTLARAPAISRGSRPPGRRVSAICGPYVPARAPARVCTCAFARLVRVRFRACERRCQPPSGAPAPRAAPPRSRPPRLLPGAGCRRRRRRRPGRGAAGCARRRCRRRRPRGACKPLRRLAPRAAAQSCAPRGGRGSRTRGAVGWGACVWSGWRTGAADRCGLRRRTGRLRCRAGKVARDRG